MFWIIERGRVAKRHQDGEGDAMKEHKKHTDTGERTPTGLESVTGVRVGDLDLYCGVMTRSLSSSLYAYLPPYLTFEYSEVTEGRST